MTTSSEDEDITPTITDPRFLPLLGVLDIINEQVNPNIGELDKHAWSEFLLEVMWPTFREAVDVAERAWGLDPMPGSDAAQHLNEVQRVVSDAVASNYKRLVRERAERMGMRKPDDPR